MTGGCVKGCAADEAKPTATPLHDPLRDPPRDPPRDPRCAPVRWRGTLRSFRRCVFRSRVHARPAAEYVPLTPE
ncbi:hypothetical protein GCM10010211_54560 [Streptomyces albospinus]|uniref:Uncharacterized protein n=1 Tax=Streptomyces albospinus TaxID=285515 RepID=A0ABQ2VFN2_9ACTN|nr:hypothetical protein GCM10010211_54560 [Streptomyces albospinus]